MLVFNVVFTLFLITTAIAAVLWFTIGRRLYAKVNRYCESHDRVDAEHRAELDEEARLRRVAEEELEREFNLEHMIPKSNGETEVRLREHPDGST